MKKLLLICYCLSTCCCSSNQFDGIVVGRTGNLLPGVTLESPDSKTYTNELGRFKFNKKPTAGILVIHAMGFTSKQINISSGIPTKIVLDAQIPELRQIP
jgi:hypothetical protein